LVVSCSFGFCLPLSLWERVRVKGELCEKEKALAPARIRKDLPKGEGKRWGVSHKADNEKKRPVYAVLRYR